MVVTAISNVYMIKKNHGEANGEVLQQNALTTAESSTRFHFVSEQRKRIQGAFEENE